MRPWINKEKLNGRQLRKQFHLLRFIRKKVSVIVLTSNRKLRHSEGTKKNHITKLRKNLPGLNQHDSSTNPNLALEVHLRLLFFHPEQDSMV